MKPREFDRFLEDAHAKVNPLVDPPPSQERGEIIFASGWHKDRFMAEYKRNMQAIADVQIAARARGKLVCGVEPLDDA